MSVQASTWAFAQNIRNRGKVVLLALANHADHTTGHCWPSIDLLMEEASCSRASIYSFLAALQRNGYITVRKPKGGNRSHDIWINFDRIDAPWINVKKDADEDNIPQDDEGDEPQDVVASPNSGISCDVENPASDSKFWTPRVQDLDSLHNTDSEPSVIEPSLRESPAKKPDAPLSKPQAVVPPSFNPTARQSQIAKLQAAEEARSKNQRIPVLEGSDPWKSWVKHGHPPDLSTWVIFDGKSRRGWYFPQLYPPKSTGPPADFEPMNELEAELARP